MCDVILRKEIPLDSMCVQYTGCVQVSRYQPKLIMISVVYIHAHIFFLYSYLTGKQLAYQNRIETRGVQCIQSRPWDSGELIVTRHCLIALFTVEGEVPRSLYTVHYHCSTVYIDLCSLLFLVCSQRQHSAKRRCCITAGT